MKGLLKNIPLGKVAVVAVAIVTGIGTVMEAVNGNKVEGDIKNLQKRLSELESNIQK